MQRNFYIASFIFCTAASCFAQKPALVFPFGHTGAVSSVRFSPDNKYLVSAGEDNAVKIWERASGHPVKSLNYAPYVASAWFGKTSYEVMVSENTREFNRYKQIPVATWDPIQNFIKKDSMLVSPDKRLAIWSRGDWFSNLAIPTPFSYVLDRKTKLKLKEFPCGSDDEDQFAFSRNGNFFLHLGKRHPPETVLNGSDTVITDLYSSKTLKRIYHAAQTGSWGRQWPDVFLTENFLMMRNGDSTSSVDMLTGQTNISAWPFNDKKPDIIPTSKPDRPMLIANEGPQNASPSYFHVFIYDFRSGKVCREFPGEKIRDAFYSSAGGGLVVLSEKDSICSIYHAETGKLVNSFAMPFVSGGENSISSDGKFICTAGADWSIRIYEIATGRLAESFNAQSAPLLYTRFSKSGRYLFIMDSTSLRAWDTQKGKFAHLFEGIPKAMFVAEGISDNYFAVTSANDSIYFFSTSSPLPLFSCKGLQAWSSAWPAFDKSGKYFFQWNDSVTDVRDAGTGRLIHEYKKKQNQLSGLSPDYNYYFSTTDSVTVERYESTSGKLYGTIHSNGYPIDQLQFSDDSRFFITTSSKDGSFTCWNNSTNKPIYTKNSGGRELSVSIGPGGKFILTQSGENHTKFMLYKAETGELTRQFTLPATDGGKLFIDPGARFSPDGERLFASSIAGNIELYCNTGKTVERTRENGHPYGVSSNTPVIERLYEVDNNSHDSVWVVYNRETMDTIDVVKSGPGYKNMIYSGDSLHYAAVNGNLIRIGRLPDVNNYYLLNVFSKDDYLAVDKEGRFEGTEAARKQVYYVCGLESVDIGQLRGISSEPSLVAKLEGGNKDAFITHPAAIPICNNIPDVADGRYSDNFYDFTIHSKQGGIGELQVFVNGKQVGSYAQSDLKRQQDSYRLRVNGNSVQDAFVEGRENIVSLRATTRGGNLSSREFSIRVPASGRITPTKLYLLSIGINQYNDTGLHLHYAVQDAKSFSAFMAAAARKLLNTDGQEHVISFLNIADSLTQSQGTKVSILATLDSIARFANPSDIFVFFFAGHGGMVADKKEYYLLTAEASSAEQLETFPGIVSISTTELQRWMTKIKANKQILIVDACNSGRIAELLNFKEKESRGIPGYQQLALENLRDKTGTVVFAASASSQRAYESGAVGQGLLTYSLLWTIKNGDAVRSPGLVDVSSWFSLSSYKVQQMARKVSERQDPQIMGAANFDIGLADQPIRNDIILREPGFTIAKAFIVDGVNLSDRQNLTLLLNKSLSELAYNSDTPYDIVDDPGEETLTIRGRYQADNGQLSGQFSIFKSSDTELTSFTVRGKLNDKTGFCKQIAEKLIDYLKGINVKKN